MFMKSHPALFPVAFILVALLWQSLSTQSPQQAHAYIPQGHDSLLIVKNGIHKMRAISETQVTRDHRWEFQLGDTIPTATERVVSWTEFDKKGRVISVVDSSTASDHKNLKMKTQEYVYDKDKLIRHSVKEWYESPGDTGKAMRVVWVEITNWDTKFTLHHTEEEEAGQWNMQIDSTVFNPDGQKRLTYTYNSMGDSFVEEFTYDAKARLKYRRLSMQLFWSPPWEMESSTYTYHDDGSHVRLDSVWRIDPDMNAARKRAGDKRAPDYAWKVLMAAPVTGTFNRLENRDEYTYNARGDVTRTLWWSPITLCWDDYTWVYDAEGKLVHNTERRGRPPGEESDPCTDSTWYEYKNGILYHEKVRRYCNTYYTSYDDTFQVNGVPVDPNRSFSFKYEDKEFGIVEVITRYEHNSIVETTSFNEKGLMIKREFVERLGNETVTKFTYFRW